jgi:hypothetical protein
LETIEETEELMEPGWWTTAKKGTTEMKTKSSWMTMTITHMMIESVVELIKELMEERWCLKVAGHEVLVESFPSDCNFNDIEDKWWVGSRGKSNQDLCWRRWMITMWTKLCIREIISIS